MATGNFEVKGILSVEDKMSNVLKNAQSSLSGFGKISKSSFSGASSSMDSMSGSAGKARSSIMSIATGVGAVQVVGKAFDMIKGSVSGAISRFDTLNQYPKVMKQLGYSTSDVSKSMVTLKNGVVGLPTALDDVVSTTQRFASITGDVDTAAKTTIALNDAFLASGASSADASRGLQQYTQMLSSGKVDMMSWRTLQETMPGSLKKVAEAFGFTGRAATNDLYAALQDGNITMDQVNKKFVELDGGANGFAKQAKIASGGIQTSFDNMKNAITRGTTAAIKGIDDFVKSISGKSVPEWISQFGTTVEKGMKKVGPALKSAETPIKNLINYVKQNSDWLVPLTVGIGSFAGTFKIISTGVKAFKELKTAIEIIKIAAMVKDFTLLSQALGVLAKTSKIAAAAQLALNFAMSLNPVVLIISAIIAVVAALVWFFTQTKTGRKIVAEVVKAIQKSWEELVKFLTPIFKSIGDKAKEIWDGVVEACQPVIDKIVEIWQGLVEFFTNLWNTIKDVAKSAWDSFSDFMTPIIEVVKNLWNGLVDFFTNLWTNIKNTATDTWNGFTESMQPVIEAIKNLWDSLVEFFTTLWNAIKTGANIAWTGFTSFMAPIVETVKNLWNGLVDFFTNLWNTIKMVANIAWVGFTAFMAPIVETVKNLWNGLVEFFTNLWNTISLIITTALSVIGGVIGTAMSVIGDIWSTAWDVIKTLVSTVWNIITTIISTAINVVAGIIRAITNVIKGDWSGAWNEIKGVANTIWNGIKSVITIAINGIKSVITSVLNGISSIWESVWGGIKSFAQGVWNGMKSALESAMNAMKTVVSNVVNAIKRTFDKLGNIDLGAAGRAIMKSFEKGLKDVWGGIQDFIGGIGSWIEKHKGPIQYDRKLLIPAGKAIMSGLDGGLTTGFRGVKSNVAGMAGNISSLMENGVNGFDIGGVINSTNKKLQGELQSNVTNKIALSTQPANISLQMGNAVYGGFVDDITSQQSTATSLRIDRRF